MKYEDLTSIILPIWIPSKDKEKYIQWTLESLDETVDSDFELIIIDNQSTKNSVKFIEKLVKKIEDNSYCKRVKFICCKKNRGWTGGWEIGIKNSVGKYTCVINDDLIFSKKWLSKMLVHLRDDIVAIGPTSNFVTGKQSVKFNIPNINEQKVNYLIGLCLLIKRESLDAIYDHKNNFYIDPQFYPGGSEELDVCIRLSKAGCDMVIARDVFIHHFGNRSLAYVEEFQKGQREFYNKRLQLLEKKHGRDKVSVLDEFQLCPKIAIGIPSIGQTDSKFVAMYPWLLEAAWQRFGFNNVIPIVSPRNLTHIGRSKIVETAINYGVEYLWFIDDDMIIQPDTLSRLYAHQKDFVSALAYCRIKPYNPCIYTGKDEDGNWIPDTRLRNGLIEVDATGLSCALIKMSIVKKLLKEKGKQIKKRGGLFYHNRFGEDMNFTNELKEVGFNIFVDSDIIIKHLGNKQLVSEKTFLDYKRQELNSV